MSDENTIKAIILPDRGGFVWRVHATKTLTFFGRARTKDSATARVDKYNKILGVPVEICYGECTCNG